MLGKLDQWCTEFISGNVHNLFVLWARNTELVSVGLVRSHLCKQNLEWQGLWLCASKSCQQLWAKGLVGRLLKQADMSSNSSWIWRHTYVYTKHISFKQESASKPEWLILCMACTGSNVQSRLHYRKHNFSRNSKAVLGEGHFHGWGRGICSLLNNALWCKGYSLHYIHNCIRWNNIQ